MNEKALRHKADSALTWAIIDLRLEVRHLVDQRDYPLQDDWDDALHAAADHVRLAAEHVEAAKRLLKEGT